MGLKRRHKKQQHEKFDPKRVVKLDHKRKCFVVDEAPRFPLIATPRQLQKRLHYFSESETESEENSSSNNDSFIEISVSSNTNNSNNDNKNNNRNVCSGDLICMSSSSIDSGFEGGGTAPASPKKMLGKDNIVEISILSFSISLVDEKI